MKKADEMEVSITLKAIRISWIYSMVFLLIWVLIVLIQTSELPYIPFALLSSDMIVMLLSTRIINRHMSGKKQNEE